MNIEEIIRRVVTEVTIPDDERLWDAAQIAQYLNVGTRQVAERYALEPDFPTPVRLPSPSGTKAQKRWRMVEVLKWAKRRQAR